jgi:signal transduction histidine kinase
VYRWFLVRAVPLRDARGKIFKWYGTSTDIEERERSRQLESELAHFNRVSMLGELTASLAHEINQPITGTITSADACLRWLTREEPDLEEARANVTRIKQDGQRAAEIINRLRSFYKKDTATHREPVDVNEVVGEILVLLRSEANRYSIVMRTELTAGLPKVRADRVQLQQVLMNLMLNGIEAMSGTDANGELTIRSRREDGQVVVSVSDTGVGLPADKMDQIFSSFFTTKPAGTGMGLSISRSIVESHGGRLWASNNDRGATFHFTLPIEAPHFDEPRV